MPTNTILFSGQSEVTGPFGMVFWDSTVAPNAFAVTTGGMNELDAGGKGLDLATVSEFFPSGGMATAWGIRYRVYAEFTSGTDGVLKAVDLRKATTMPPNPAAVQVSNGTVASMHLCPQLPPALFDNYSAAPLSWMVFHALGPDMDCGTLDDQIVAVQMSMSSSTAPKALSQLEPVEAIYNTSGSITGFLAINHPTICSTMGGCAGGIPFGAPLTPVPLQQLDASLTSTKTFATNLTGNGSNLPGGDFRSLGVSSGNIWLYVDSSSLYALDLGSGTTTAISGFTLGTADVIQGRAVFDPADATKAYVAFASNTVPGSTIVQINLSAKTAVSQARDAAGANGITLVGVSSANVVYLINDGTAIKTVAKPTLTGTAALTTLSGTQLVDSLMGPNGALGPPIAFLVGDTVYYTVADSSASGGTGVAKQPFSVAASGGSATPLGSGVGAVLGVVAPASIPTTGPYTNAGALVLTGGANGSTGGQAVFASASVASTLGLYNASGALARSLGSFTMTNPSTSMARVQPMTGVSLNGPVQAGIPATLETYGPDGVGTVSNDFAMFASDGSITLTELSGFLQ
jgi:hypothetical protein